MVGLADLAAFTNEYTGVMVAFLWVAAGVGYRLLKSGINENHDDLELLAADHQGVRQDLHRVDQKQDHIVQRQEVMLDRLGMNEQEIQDLREEHARLDAETPDRNDFYRGSPGDD